MIAMALACRPELLHRRRADDRARRDHPGPDPGPARRAPGEHRHGDHVHHPRPRRRRRDRRPCGRHVRRRGRRARPVDDALRQPDASLHEGLLRSIPRCRRMAARGACRADRPARCRRRRELPPGCRFAPRCALRDAALRGAMSRRLLGHMPATGTGALPRGAPPHEAGGACLTRSPLVVEDLRKFFRSAARPAAAGRPASVRAVDGVSLHPRARRDARRSSANRGCGKSTLGRAAAAPGRARPPVDLASTARTSRHCAGKAMRPRCRQRMQIIFQDPYRLAEPAHARRARSLAEPLACTGRRAGGARERGRARCSTRSACRPERCERYPHEFSGGQRQRIAHRAGAGARARVHRRRRAGLRARRLGPGAGPLCCRDCSERRRLASSSSRTTSASCAFLRPDGGHVSRPDRRDRADDRRLRAAAASLHPAAARCFARPDPR